MSMLDDPVLHGLANPPPIDPLVGGAISYRQRGRDVNNNITKELL